MGHDTHALLLSLQEIIGVCNEYLAVFAGIFLVLSAFLGCANVLLAWANHVFGSRWPSLLPSCGHGSSKRVATLAHTRIEVGSLFAIGLELLVVTDVLETLIKPIHLYSYELLGKIGAVAAGRLVLAYFLGKEMDALRKEEAEEGPEEDESPVPPPTPNKKVVAKEVKKAD